MAPRADRRAATATRSATTSRATLSTLVRHAQNKGFVDTRLDPDTVATLVIATLNGLFMVPVANIAPGRVDKALAQLEGFLSLMKSSHRHARAIKGSAAG
jgi:hypothetical protein